MEYDVYKLTFSTGVHFGGGMLNDSENHFYADSLFSALYIEALKIGKEKSLYEYVSKGELLFSDAFPYVGEQYMIPKPMLYVETGRKGESEDKKKYKKLKYLPIEWLESYLKGELELREDPMKNFGTSQIQTMAAVRRDKETLPFHVGTYYYNENRGLYIIVAFQSSKQRELMEQLMSALSYVGIGGKKSVGLGKFFYDSKDAPDSLINRLNSVGKYQLLLSTALPQKEELESALEGSSYLLLKRSGFVDSPTYADELRRKRDLYVFQAGSCFKNRFCGMIEDVSEGGRHSVYRYAKPLFMGV